MGGRDGARLSLAPPREANGRSVRGRRTAGWRERAGTDPRPSPRLMQMGLKAGTQCRAERMLVYSLERGDQSPKVEACVVRVHLRWDPAHALSELQRRAPWAPASPVSSARGSASTSPRVSVSSPRGLLSCSPKPRTLSTCPECHSQTRLLSPLEGKPHSGDFPLSHWLPRKKVHSQYLEGINILS